MCATRAGRTLRGRLAAEGALKLDAAGDGKELPDLGLEFLHPLRPGLDADAVRRAAERDDLVAVVAVVVGARGEAGGGRGGVEGTLRCM